MNYFKCLHRITCDYRLLLPELEATHDPVTLPGGDRCQRYTFRGVPAKLVDVIIAPDDGQMVLEIGRKVGKFNGAFRDRLTLRPWRSWKLEDHAGKILPARLFIQRSEGRSETVEQMERLAANGDGEALDALHDPLLEAGSELTIAVIWEGGQWLRTWPCLRSNLLDYDLPAIVLWHWNRYYHFLSYEDAKALADAFESSHPAVRGLTLAEANRAASRDLYRLARDLGWRKLTLREANKYQLPAGWVLVDRLDKRRAEMGYPSRNGAGQYTNEAAAGLPMQEEPVRTAYEQIVVE